MSIIALYGLLFGVGIWGIANLAIFVGLTPGMSSLLMQFSAFFTIILSGLFFKEKITFIQSVGMVIAISGLIVALYFSSDKSSLLGGILTIIAAFSWSVCNIIIKKYKPTEVLSFVIWSSLFSAPPLFIITYLTKGSSPFVHLHQALNYQSVFSICFQAYITTLFGYWIWNKLLKKYEASLIAPFSLLIPIFGFLTSHIIFSEEVGFYKIIATILILVGIYILVFGAKTKEKIAKLFKPKYF